MWHTWIAHARASKLIEFNVMARARHITLQQTQTPLILWTEFARFSRSQSAHGFIMRRCAIVNGLTQSVPKNAQFAMRYAPSNTHSANAIFKQTMHHDDGGGGGGCGDNDAFSHKAHLNHTHIVARSALNDDTHTHTRSAQIDFAPSTWRCSARISGVLLYICRAL